MQVVVVVVVDGVDDLSEVLAVAWTEAVVAVVGIRCWYLEWAEVEPGGCALMALVHCRFH